MAVRYYLVSVCSDSVAIGTIARTAKLPKPIRLAIKGQVSSERQQVGQICNEAEIGTLMSELILLSNVGTRYSS